MYDLYFCLWKTLLSHTSFSISNLIPNCYAFIISMKDVCTHPFVSCFMLPLQPPTKTSSTISFSGLCTCATVSGCNRKHRKKHPLMFAKPFIILTNDYSYLHLWHTFWFHLKAFPFPHYHLWAIGKEVSFLRVLSSYILLYLFELSLNIWILGFCSHLLSTNEEVYTFDFQILGFLRHITVLVI